jgi:hypothetical protein
MGANPGSATDAGFKLDVLGTTRLNGNTTVTGVLTGSDTIRSTNGTVAVSLSYGSTAGIIGTTSNHSLEIRTNNTYRVGVSTAGVVNIANLIGTGSRIVVADSAGNLSATTAIGDFVTINTTQTITGAKTFNNLTTFNQNIVGGIIKLSQGVLLSKSAAVGTDAGFLSLIATSATGLNYINIADGDSPSNTQRFAIPNTGTFTYTFPDASGTVALTSDIPSLTNYVTLNGTQTITGAKTFSTLMTAQHIKADYYGFPDSNGYSTGFESTSNNTIQVKIGSGLAINIASNNNTTFYGNIIRNGGTSSQFLKADGSLDSNTYATTSSLSSYLPLSGGTLTGALNGTSATFSGNVQINNGQFFNAKRADGAGINILGIEAGGNDLISVTAGNFKLRNTGGGDAANLLMVSSAGHLGLGVSPSAWGGSSKAIQIGARMSVYNDGFNNALFANNTYFNGSDNYYISTAAAARFYIETSGSFIWQNAPSGTAGNAISFTTAMTLDASGRLGIGNTIMSSFDGSANQLVVGTGTTNQGITIYASTSTESSLYFADGTGAASYRGYIFYNHAQDLMAIGTNGARAITILNSGNVGINSTNPDSKFHVGASNGSQIRFDFAGSGDNYYDGVTHYFRNGNGASNVMTLLNNGNVGIGSTNPGSRIEIAGTTGSYNSGIGFVPAGTGARNYRTFISTDGSFRFDDATAGATRLTISSTGVATFSGDVKVKTLEVTNVGTDAGSSGLSTYMRITVNGQNYLIPLHGTP